MTSKHDVYECLSIILEDIERPDNLNWSDIVNDIELLKRTLREYRDIKIKRVD